MNSSTLCLSLFNVKWIAAPDLRSLVIKRTIFNANLQNGNERTNRWRCQGAPNIDTNRSPTQVMQVDLGIHPSRRDIEFVGGAVQISELLKQICCPIQSKETKVKSHTSQIIRVLDSCPISISLSTGCSDGPSSRRAFLIEGCSSVDSLRGCAALLIRSIMSTKFGSLSFP
jgi:hypothetical protein